MQDFFYIPVGFLRLKYVTPEKGRFFESESTRSDRIIEVNILRVCFDQPFSKHALSSLLVYY